MFAREFVQNALLAGLPISLACGAVGYFIVLRSQVFAADTLSHVAFTGALAAAAASVDLRLGLFAATLIVAMLLARLGDHAHADDVTIGIIFVWILGLGVLFLDLFNRGVGGGTGIVAARTLFGSIFGLGTNQAQLAGAIGLGVTAILIAIGRPLLFATIDPHVAAARGVPVALLGSALLALLAVTAADATQAVGALLLLGLIAAPAGAAHRLTANPYLGLALSSLIAAASTLVGIAAAYTISTLPPSTAIIATAAGIYAIAYLTTIPATRWQAFRTSAAPSRDPR